MISKTAMLIIFAVMDDGTSRSPLDFVVAEEVNRCGPRSLQVCAAYLGTPVTAAEIEQWLPSDGHMTSYEDLRNAASHLGLRAKAVRWKNRPSIPLDAPAILSVELKGRPHFVVALATRSDDILVVDVPNSGWISYQELASRYAWTGNALHFATSSRSLLPIQMAIHGRKIRIAGSILICGACIWGWRWKRRRVQRRDSKHAVHNLTCSLALFLFLPGCNQDRLPDSFSNTHASTPQEILRQMVTLSPKEGEIRSPDNGSKATLDLRLGNRGSSPVQILSVETSCGCTIAGEPTLSRLEQGQSATIPLSFQLPTTGLKPVRVMVHVSNDQTTSAVSANLVMHGGKPDLPSVISMPPSIRMKEQRDHSFSGHFRIRTHERLDSPFWIQSFVAEPSASIALDVQVNESDVDGFYGVREYTINAKNKEGPIERRYQLSAKDAAGTIIRRSILQVEAWSPAVISPQVVFFSDLNLTPRNSRKLSVFWVDQSISPVGLAAQSDSEFIDVTTPEFDASSRRHNIQVQLDRTCLPAPNASGQVELRFQLSDGDDYTATVPVVVKTDSESRTE